MSAQSSSSPASLKRSEINLLLPWCQGDFMRHTLLLRFRKMATRGSLKHPVGWQTHRGFGTLGRFKFQRCCGCFWKLNFGSCASFIPNYANTQGRALLDASFCWSFPLARRSRLGEGGSTPKLRRLSPRCGPALPPQPGSGGSRLTLGDGDGLEAVELPQEAAPLGGV